MPTRPGSKLTSHAIHRITGFAPLRSPLDLSRGDQKAVSIDGLPSTAIVVDG